MKKALVTSSTKGIGKEIVLKLLKDGYYVFINFYNDAENVKLLKKELNYKYKNMFKIIRADLSSINGIYKISEKIKYFTNELDCIVLNTAKTSYKSLKEISLVEWNSILDTNLSLPFFLLKELDDILVDNGDIIFISSRMGDVPHGRSIPYAVSKAGLNMLSKSLVKFYSDRRIRVNTISIGFANTTWHNNKDVEHLDRIKNKIALKRLGEPEEVASLCKHIIDNKYINGAIINIDGGYDML
jgi:3-oxoacyl-[acyl-carrier protein] reductase